MTTNHKKRQQIPIVKSDRDIAAIYRHQDCHQDAAPIALLLRRCPPGFFCVHDVKCPGSAR